MRAAVAPPRWAPATAVRRVPPRPFCRNHGACRVLERTPGPVGASLEIMEFFAYLSNRPTVSLLMIPLVYCPINIFQRASSMEKPFPGGEKRRDGRAAHPVEWGGD